MEDFQPQSASTYRRISSINDLPLEILQEIFITCSANERQEFPLLSSQNSNQRAPMLLTHVCRQWRDICNSLPYLWSSFATTRRKDDLPKEWLRRSGNAVPLDVDISKGLSNEMEQVLLKNSTRWRLLRGLHSSRSVMDKLLLSTNPRDMPNLEAIALSCAEGDLDPSSSYLTSALNSITSLRQLSLDIYHYDGAEFDPGLLPLENLTHIHISIPHFISVTLDVNAFLERCTRATHITLTNLIPPPRRYIASPHLPLATLQPLHTERVPLPYLQALDLSGKYNLKQALKYFHCPALRHLSLKEEFVVVSERTDASGFGALSSFIRRTPSLHRVRLALGGPAQGELWERLLKHLEHPGLQKIPEVEVWAECSALFPQRPVRFHQKYRCPVADCTLYHLGWTLSRHRHLGTPGYDGADYVDSPLWQPLDPVRTSASVHGGVQLGFTEPDEEGYILPKVPPDIRGEESDLDIELEELELEQDRIRTNRAYNYFMVVFFVLLLIS